MKKQLNNFLDIHFLVSGGLKNLSGGYSYFKIDWHKKFEVNGETYYVVAGTLKIGVDDCGDGEGWKRNNKCIVCLELKDGKLKFDYMTDYESEEEYEFCYKETV